MLYRFGPFELDPGRFELRERGDAVAAEPQVLSLLLFLVANRHRLVTRDDVVEAVWHGRIVSDSAISSRVKSVRRLIGDDGNAQRLIRTVHGRGFRFVAKVEELPSPCIPAAALPQPPVTEPERPSIAILPLLALGDLGSLAIAAEALPHEIIRELARLRWLFVIARASAFRVGRLALDVRQIGQILGVRYVLSGTIETSGRQLTVAVELSDTHDSGVIWAEHFSADVGAIHELHANIVACVVAALEVRIPVHEANRARLVSCEALDAWSAYHLGLQRMFRFTAGDNAAAAALFTRAIANAPGFARGYAGLSFTRFQDAFLNYADRATATAAARDTAEKAVALDPLDPFANLAMGRAYWLSGDLEGSLAWLDRSSALSPNYAQATYARAWAETLLSRSDDGLRHADQALALSPVDPMRYAMLATRSLSHLVRGEDVLAVVWAERAAREPGAHALIAVIAAACQAGIGDTGRAKVWIDIARRRHPALTRDAFFQSFPFSEPVFRSRMQVLLDRSGLR